MNDNQYFLTHVTLEKGPQPLDWRGRATVLAIQAFTQSAPMEEKPNGLCAHDLFILFTAAVIEERRVFVR